MASRIVWSRSSIRDLIEIRTYIAKDSPLNASRFIIKLRSATEALIFPHAFRVVPLSEDPDVREIIVAKGNYRVIYEIETSGRVRILRVFRVSRLLKPHHLEEET
jgi:addiction module RelE/StbE family toxin